MLWCWDFVVCEERGELDRGREMGFVSGCSVVWRLGGSRRERRLVALRRRWPIMFRHMRGCEYRSCDLRVAFRSEHLQGYRHVATMAI